MPTFKTTDNTSLFYREQGHGPLLLILPGNTASSACHEQELAYFGRRYQAVSLDFRGTGQSDRLESWPADWWEQAAHDAAALVAHLGQEGVLVMGTSGGGVAALLMAILHPERVRAVVADSCAERQPPDWLREIVKIRALRTPGQVGFWQFAHGDDWSQVVEADSALMLRLAKERDGDWFQGRLSQIRCPVLLTASLQDSALRDIGPQLCHMAGQIPRSETFLVNDGDHPLMWSRAELFREVVDGFLGRQSETENGKREA